MSERTHAGAYAIFDRARIKKLMAREEKRFVEEHPRSKALFERAKSSLLAGVPMNWMAHWVGAFPIFAKEAKDGYVIDADGHRYVDFCMGDSGAMFGHSPEPVVDAVTERVRHGITMVLPTEDSIWVGEELARRFGLPYWQIVLTATDANRFAIRVAREATQRKRVLVFNHCYHGTVEEALVELRNGVVVRRPTIGPPPHDPATTTKVVEFNDLEALEAALSPEDVACVLCEPVMTQQGLFFPDPGYHDALRAITRRYGTLLIIDETHTICSGPGGYTAEHALEPDILTIGKPIASGVPAAAYGLSQDVADKILRRVTAIEEALGVGGTLSGNALTVAAMRATLEHVITKQAFDRAIPLAERFAQDIDRIIKAEHLPWYVARLGIRVEWHFRPTPPRSHAEAAAGTQHAWGRDPELDRLMQLYTLNRGIMLTPFHHIAALISPHATARDIDLHTRVFDECVKELSGTSQI